MKQLFLSCVVVGLILTTSAQAQSERVRVGQDTFERATFSIITWLKNITGSLDQIVATENRIQLRERLHRLNESLYGVETAKTEFLQSLEREKQPRPDGLVLKVNALRRDVRQLAILLREEYGKGGFECEQLLSSATGEEKLWLYDLSSNFERLADNEKRVQIIEQGNRAVVSLRTASLELAKLTRRLEREER